MPDLSSENGNRVGNGLSNGSATNHYRDGQTNGSAESEYDNLAPHQLSIIIVGAGLGGLAAAISCSLAGHKVTVLEAATKLSEVGAGIQLSPNTTRLLRRWGLFSRLAPLAVRPNKICFRRWQSGEPIGITKLVPDFEDNFGSPYWVVHRAHLHNALLDRAEELGALVHVNSKAVAMDFDKGTVKVVSCVGVEKMYTADLILGCDGLKSITRTFFLNGSDVGPQPSPYCAYRATVPMDLLKSDPELAPLVEQADLGVWIGHKRHVMSYPINGGKTFNMVLSHPDDETQEWTTDPVKVLTEMKTNYEGWDPRLTKIISLIDNTAKWKLMTYPRMETWRHDSGKYVLMGDACHAMLPYMSQGAAQAIEDAAALGRCLARCSTVESLPSLTRYYEEIRKERAYAVQEKSALNGRIWHYPDGDDQRRRDAGMAASLTDEHYIRSTNQWSDPATQIWLYNHDAERVSTNYLDARLGPVTSSKRCIRGVDEMVEAGLLAA